MIIYNSEITLSAASSLTEEQFELIKADSNVLRSLMGKSWSEVITEHTSWIIIQGNRNSDFIGTFMCDQVDEKTGAVCMHILIREGYYRECAVTATKLAAFMARLRGLIPYTTVSTDPAYDYMRRFLSDCGFVHHMRKDDFEIITIPTNYVPLLDQFTISNLP